METARIVAALVPADARSVPTLVAALLHDVVDDTQVTLSDLRLAFGADVEALVSGVSKLSKLNQQASVFTNVHQRFFFVTPLAAAPAQTPCTRGRRVGHTSCHASTS